MNCCFGKKVFVWPTERYNDAAGQLFIVSVDGVDFKVWEKKHPTLPYDRGQYSHKYNYGTLKYEVAIDTQTSKVVWINGPFRGGESDKNIYLSALRDKIPDGKKIIVDRVYGSSAQPDDHRKLGLPNRMDDQVTAKFKARLRCRHESFNGRLNFFKVLQDTFHHRNESHKDAFLSVAVMVQYQMDCGAPLFD